MKDELVKLSYRLRQLGVMGTVALQRAIVDPANFLSLLSERVRQSKFPFSNKIAFVGRSLSRSVGDPGGIFERLETGALNDRYQGKSIGLRSSYIADLKGELTANYPSNTFKQRQKRSASDEARVLLFLNNSEPHTKSGYTVRTSGLLKALKSKGVVLDVVTRLGFPASVGKLADAPTETSGGQFYSRLIPVAMPMYPSRIRAKTVELLVRRLSSNDIDVLHTTTPFRNALIVSEAAARLGMPWVYEVRGQPEDTWLSKQKDISRAALSFFYRSSKSQETAAMLAANAVIVLSEIQKEMVVRRGVDPNKIWVAPNAVDDNELKMLHALTLPKSKTDIRNELGLPTEKRLVGIISSLVGYEGVDTLLKAFEDLPSDAMLLIVGDGEEKPKLERLAKELNLDERVRFAGRQPADEIGKWYAALDLFVVPRRDTDVTRAVTPIKPVMAMALGCPIIASDLPPLREITGGLARYVEPEDSDALARAILDELENPSSPAKMQEFANRHSWSFVAESYLDVYRNLI